MTHLLPPPKPRMDLMVDGAEKRCSPASLRGHIVNVHLAPIVLWKMGLPRYDLQVAQRREIELDWVVKKAMDRLEDAAVVVGQEAPSQEIDAYRTYVAKTLHLIADMRLSAVPWREAEAIFPGASDLKIDFRRDVLDRSYSAEDA